MKAATSLFLFMAVAAAACQTSVTPSHSPIATTPASPSTAGQSPPRQSTTQPTDSFGLVADSASGISFYRPANWQRWQPNGHDPMTSGPLIYLSTDGVLPACAVGPFASPNPADADGFACTWPLDELEPGGLLLTAYTTRLLVPLPSDGVEIRVNGRSASMQTTKPGTCAQIGGDVTLDVLIPIGQPTPISNIGVAACLRGPNLEKTQSQVEAMLASLSVTH